MFQEFLLIAMKFYQAPTLQMLSWTHLFMVFADVELERKKEDCKKVFKFIFLAYLFMVLSKFFFMYTPLEEQ